MPTHDRSQLDELPRILEGGFFADSLSAVADCIANLNESTATPGPTLLAEIICRDLAERWGGQAIPTSEYEALERRYAGPLLALLESIADGDQEPAWRCADLIAAAVLTE